MKTLKQLLSAVVLSVIASTASAQETTPNLINNTWNNVTTGSHPNDCCTGGPNPLYDPATNTIHFSYGNTAVHQVRAINQALSGSGIQINGWNWGYDLRNMDGVAGNQNRTIDTINVTSFITNNAGQIVQQSDQYYNTQFDWTRFSGTENLNSPILLENNVNLGIQFVSRDNGFWGGYYGPQVRNVTLTANYGVDQCAVNPQSSPSCPGFKTYYNNMWDDGYQRVDLPFTFPFYGQHFNTSYMFTNGVVGFLNPDINSFCCSGVNMNQFPGSPWNFAIYGLQTDLGPGADSQFWSQIGDNGTSMRYGWDRVYELGTNNASTFNIQIKDSGYVGINYESVNVQYNTVTAGIAGDISQGQYSQIYHGPGSTFTPNSQYTFTGTETTDICAINPLHSTSCPGYAQAYYTQQCSINPLYDSTCPGYATAYFTQQCSINSLYDTQCPGYASAYLSYQCNINQLYSTSCPGYQQAYFDQQCSLDPLYNNQCPGYSTAYFNQQCSLDPLYDSTCTGYADAYYVQQCNANPLYDSGCTGYAEAYFNQQCSLDPLYNNQCTGYAEAYARKNILNTATAETPVTTTTVIAETTVVTASTQSTQVVADPIVNQTVTTTATSASPAAAATTTVPLVQAPPAPTATTTVAAAPAETKKEESTTADSGSSKEENKSADSSSSSTSTASSGSTSKNQPKTTRQQLAERRLEAARAKAVEEGKQLANKVGEAATMEAQVAVQNVVIAAMGFTPGFDNYSKVLLQDAPGYRPFEIYKGQRNVDNPASRRFLTGADRLHQQMVDAQYERIQK